MHMNLECPNLPHKSHLFGTNCDLEIVVPFSKPKPDLSWGCWWNFKRVVRVFELSKNFLKPLVRHATSSLSFSTVEVSSVLLARLKLSFRVWIFFFRSSFNFFNLVLVYTPLYFSPYLLTCCRGYACSTLRISLIQRCKILFQRSTYLSRNQMHNFSLLCCWK